MQDEVALPVPIAFRSHGSFVPHRMWYGTFSLAGAIMLTVISINLLGDGLRDALDPWLKGR